MGISTARLATILLLAFGSQATSAMRVSPMIVEMVTAGSNSTSRIEVQNINAVIMPFEARVMRIDFDSSGKIVETPADADFLVFPPQGALPAGGRQVVRLQWVGGNLASSRGYHLSINQIPVELDLHGTHEHDAGAQVQIVYHIKVLTTVAPPGAKANIVVVSAVPAIVASRPVPGDPVGGTRPGEPGISVTVSNSGRRYALMAGSTWTIDGTGIDDKPLHLVISQDDLSHILGAGYVPAIDGRRTFEIPTGAAFSAKPIKIRFSD